MPWPELADAINNHLSEAAPHPTMPECLGEHPQSPTPRMPPRFETHQTMQRRERASKAAISIQAPGALATAAPNSGGGRRRWPAATHPANPATAASRGDTGEHSAPENPQSLNPGPIPALSLPNNRVEHKIALTTSTTSTSQAQDDRKSTHASFAVQISSTEPLLLGGDHDPLGVFPPLAGSHGHSNASRRTYSWTSRSPEHPPLMHDIPRSPVTLVLHRPSHRCATP